MMLDDHAGLFELLEWIGSRLGKGALLAECKAFLAEHAKMLSARLGRTVSTNPYYYADILAEQGLVWKSSYVHNVRLRLVRFGPQALLKEEVDRGEVFVPRGALASAQGPQGQLQGGAQAQDDEADPAGMSAEQAYMLAEATMVEVRDALGQLQCAVRERRESKRELDR